MSYLFVKYVPVVLLCKRFLQFLLGCSDLLVFYTDILMCVVFAYDCNQSDHAYV